MILQECAERLDEFGEGRVEYVILALHTMNAGLWGELRHGSNPRSGGGRPALTVATRIVGNIGSRLDLTDRSHYGTIKLA